MARCVEMVDVSKRYRVGRHGDLRETLAQVPRRLLGREPPRRHYVWPLRDINLTLDGGEALAVVGRNGAGKSTLLRVLSGITPPTSGVSRTRGRVASLLEVGTGFHQELTGRENVYLNGALLGMTRSDIRRRFDEIVEFAGVGEFLDTPIKRYSSGMYLRLAFAVAAHLEPDILVVDEVLAVGDAEFQRRSLARMSEAAQEGRTLLFVSHDLEAAARLCPRAVWLDGGRIVAAGPSAEVIDRYLMSGFQRQVPSTLPPDAAAPVVVDRVEVLGPDLAPRPILLRSQELTIRVHLTVVRESPGVDVAVYVENNRYVRILDEHVSDVHDLPRLPPGRHVLDMVVPPVLNVGDYTVGVWVGRTGETIVDNSAATGFRLEGDPRDRPDRLVQLGLPWRHSSPAHGPAGPGPGMRGGHQVQPPSGAGTPLAVTSQVKPPSPDGSVSSAASPAADSDAT